MGIGHHLRWLISDQLLFWGIMIAPKGEEKDDLLMTLHPWFQRQVERTRSEIRRSRL